MGRTLSSPGANFFPASVSLSHLPKVTPLVQAESWAEPHHKPASFPQNRIGLLLAHLGARQ